MSTRAESDRRYKTSAKGRARTRRYRQSDHGREVRRLQSERYYYNPAHTMVLIRKSLYRTVREREYRQARYAERSAELGAEIDRLMSELRARRRR